MLDKLLSNRVFFIQIIIIIVTSLLGIILINTQAYLLRYGIAAGLFVINWYLIIDYFNQDKSIQENNYTVWFYAIWMIPFIHYFVDYRFAIALILMNYVMINVLEFENEKNDVRSAFDIGLFLAIACFFLPPIVVMFPFLLVYFLSLRGINKSIYWMFFVGFAIPILGFIQIIYLLDYQFLIPYFQERIQINSVEWNNYYIFFLPILALIVLAIADHLMNQNKQAANRKRMYILMIGFVIFWMAIFVFFNAEYHYFLAFLTLPMSVMLGKYVKHRKETYAMFKNIILIGFLILMLLFTFLNKMPKIYSLFGEVTI